MADETIAEINNSRTGSELIIDFLKSAANQLVHMLSLNYHPGFFSTTTQPLQDTKVTMQKTIWLLQELDKIEASGASVIPSVM